MKLTEYLQKESKFASIALGICLVGLFGILDLMTGPRFSFEVFFLIPVSLVVWFSGREAGIWIASASSLTWLMANLANQPSFASSAVPYWEALAKFIFLFAVAWTLPAVKKEWEQEKGSTRIDYLTKAANKRSFVERAGQEIHRSQRYQHPFSIATLDIDKFKFVNDRFGHNAGDTLLRAVADTVRKKIRVSDFLARVGGDEFSLLLPETQSEAAQIVMRRIQTHLLDLVQKNEWPVSFSIGVATFIRPPDSAEEMLRRTDLLMQAAKESGGNGVRHEVIGPVGVS